MQIRRLLRWKNVYGLFFILVLFVDNHLSRKMLEVAEGIEYIHSEGVVHGDLRGVFYF